MHIADPSALGGRRPQMLEKMFERRAARTCGRTRRDVRGGPAIVRRDYETGRCLDIDGGLSL